MSYFAFQIADYINFDGFAPSIDSVEDVLRMARAVRYPHDAVYTPQQTTTCLFSLVGELLYRDHLVDQL